MRAYKRKVIFSGAGLLERLWMHKRLKTPAMIDLFPGLSRGTLFRALTALRASGLIYGRKTPRRDHAGRPARFWWPTKRGVEVLKVILPYRDVWWTVDNRDLITLGAGVAMLGKLELMRINFFPDGKTYDARSNYLRRSRENMGH